MTHLVETLAAVIVAGYVFHRVIEMALPRTAPWHWAPMGGYGSMAIAGYIGGAGFGVWVAVAAPLGVMLPVLCISSSLRVLGYWAKPAAPKADVLILAAGMACIATSAAGFGPINLYALFYSGLEPVFLVAALALWAMWRVQLDVLVALVLGQVLWLADIGSSNLYDQVSHLFLLPVLILTGLGFSLRGVRRLLRF